MNRRKSRRNRKGREKRTTIKQVSGYGKYNKGQNRGKGPGRLGMEGTQ